MRSRMNVAAAGIVANATRRNRKPSPLTSHIYRRMLIETALAFGYHLRLEHRNRAGRCVIRIVDAVSFNADAPGPAGGLLTARLIRTSHQVPFPIDEIDRLTLVTEHLPADVVCAGTLTVGDAVRDEQYGFGVIQRFSRGGEGLQTRVLFSLHGIHELGNAEARLTALDSGALSMRVPRDGAPASPRPRSA